MSGVRRCVVAFGGNALVEQGSRGTWEEQRRNAVPMAGVVRSLERLGYVCVVTHGNGPQIGSLALQQEESSAVVPPLPLAALGAMTQGQLGHLLALTMRSGPKPLPAVAVVTHVVVDARDRAFHAPTKPIGPFLGRDDAERLAAERGWTVAEDAGRGYRRVVPSPLPVDIVEADEIRTLVGAGLVVVAAGGGGIPVTRGPDGRLVGVDAVIDKDLAAQRLASLVVATALVMVTQVPQVALDFGTPRERAVAEMTVAEAAAHLAGGQFPAGSMGPKVRAAVQFVEGGGEVAVITSAEHVLDALRGVHGTRIVRARRATPAAVGG